MRKPINLNFFIFMIFLSIIVTQFGYYLSAQRKSDRYEKLMDQCMIDGRKEYECASMLEVVR